MGKRLAFVSSVLLFRRGDAGPEQARRHVADAALVRIADHDAADGDGVRAHELRELVGVLFLVLLGGQALVRAAEQVVHRHAEVLRELEQQLERRLAQVRS